MCSRTSNTDRNSTFDLLMLHALIAQFRDVRTFSGFVGAPKCPNASLIAITRQQNYATWQLGVVDGCNSYSEENMYTSYWFGHRALSPAILYLDPVTRATGLSRIAHTCTYYVHLTGPTCIKSGMRFNVWRTKSSTCTCSYVFTRTLRCEIKLRQNTLIIIILHANLNAA